jgi:hypothetical protein
MCASGSPNLEQFHEMSCDTVGNLDDREVIYCVLIFFLLVVDSKDLEVMKTSCPTFSMDNIVVSIYGDTSFRIYSCIWKRHLIKYVLCICLIINLSFLIYLCSINFILKFIYM